MAEKKEEAEKVAPKAEAKKAAPKKAATKKAAPKAEEKKEAPKKVAAKKAAPKTKKVDFTSFLANKSNNRRVFPSTRG